MFELHVPWWELPLRAAVIYSVLLLLVRISGRRTVGQFTPFDLLMVMLLSESVSQGLSGAENSVTGAVLAAATLIALNMLISFITSRSRLGQRLIEGNAVMIGRDGRIFDDVLKSLRIPYEDVAQALRAADCDLADMTCLCLESDGTISVLQRSHRDWGVLH
jgi:uncharacterized membrane protein YcaP (DUF421 family)